MLGRAHESGCPGEAQVDVHELMPAPAMPWPKVSVIVPVYNDRDGLRGCLEALSRLSYPGPHETIVADNGSDVAVDDLVQAFPSVTFLKETRPGSYNARNAGLDRATGDILAFTDSDCRPERDWLTFAVSALNAGSDIGFVGGYVQMTLHDGSHSVAELFDLFTAFPQEHYVHSGHYAATANMVTRRDVMHRVGVFNGQLLSGGDAEWGKRVVAAGYRAAYEERAIVRHPVRKRPELFRKVRRTAVGLRDYRPSRHLGLEYVGSMFIPPVRETADLWGKKGAALPFLLKVRIFLFAWLVRVYRAWAIVRCHMFTAETAPRS